MIFDDLLKLRSGGSTPTLTGTENGSILLARDGPTGKAVVQIDKMPLQGMSVAVINPASTGTGTTAKLTVTIEAANELDFNVTQRVVATFPAIGYGAGNTAAMINVRKVASQLKYLRSVVTGSGIDGGNTISNANIQVLVGVGEIETAL